MDEQTDWTLLRVSTVQKKLKLPRPKIVQTVVFKGTEMECNEELEKIKKELKPSDKSTDDIRVEFKIRRNGTDRTSSLPENGKQR